MLQQMDGLGIWRAIETQKLWNSQQKMGQMEMEPLQGERKCQLWRLSDAEQPVQLAVWGDYQEKQVEKEVPSVCERIDLVAVKWLDQYEAG